MMSYSPGGTPAPRRLHDTAMHIKYFTFRKAVPSISFIKTIHLQSFEWHSHTITKLFPSSLRNPLVVVTRGDIMPMKQSG